MEWTDLGTEDERRCDWFWDGDIAGQDPYQIDAPCGPTITPDYTNSADVIMYDTYRTDNGTWRHELGQFDDLVAGAGEVWSSPSIAHTRLGHLG